MNQNMKFLLVGLAIAIVISVAAPFLASPAPDGLESSAENVIEESKFAVLEESEPAIQSPMPDYSIEGMGKSGEILAITIGSIAMLLIAYGIGKAAKA
ncbi:MAG: cobalt transport protein CbiN [Methanohalophilus sp. T328-1]|uniref:PDGLE domain-containing protein n=1 Tax=Methanohalophilus sp. DAL1 TaxID=1864608 RepID=UPI00079751D0|nr:PDGLE domain-containing protein [Methanohalophilus sp. DAL1]KXS42509.1 MAG: cobalt transport protein CbiN [Methanohalophilus sp. T328-1]OBZ34768.1 MAG: cobalamin biosynthesis protein CbiN [Methanohalophilus sp. DAL1]